MVTSCKNNAIAKKIDDRRHTCCFNASNCADLSLVSLSDEDSSELDEEEEDGEGDLNGGASTLVKLFFLFFFFGFSGTTLG